jgi:3-dehydroquinate synthase
MVNVKLGTRSYKVTIDPGLMDKVASHLTSRVGIVTDENVNAQHGDRLRANLDKAGIAHATIIVPPGEKSKSFAGLEHVVDGLLGAKLERKDTVLAFGGGVVGDLAGFAASITRRGMNFVQMPTTLLAQVDSSVGGKTGINTKRGKNLVGAFMQPKAVLIDPLLLETLPLREFAAGYAEIAKIALINDAGFFHWLEDNYKAVFAGGSNGLAARIHAITTAVQAKADIVERDELELGERALLNLGHTFGHAFETVTNYSHYVHGEAVSIGTVCAFRFSKSPDAARVEAHFKAAGLPTTFKDHDIEDLMQAIAQDKKVSDGKLTFILAQKIGEAYISKNVESHAIRAFLTTESGR